MRNFDEHNITNAAIDSVREARSPRIKEISESLIRHLHDFVRDIEPTQAEWKHAIDFLTRAGQMCSATRQEFILLSVIGCPAAPPRRPCSVPFMSHMPPKSPMAQ
jgi:hydroxyquinol 1,2-dioxygenase